MCIQRFYRDLLSWHVRSYMILVYDVTHLLVPAQIFPDGKYLNFDFLGYPDLRIHKGSLSGYLAHVTHPHKWHGIVMQKKKPHVMKKPVKG